MGGCLTIKLNRHNAQEVGSIITYFRRYGLGAILGLATEEDDDGNIASNHPDPLYQASDDQKRWLRDLWVRVGGSSLEELAKFSNEMSVVDKSNSIICTNGSADAPATGTAFLERTAA